MYSLPKCIFTPLMLVMALFISCTRTFAADRFQHFNNPNYIGRLVSSVTSRNPYHESKFSMMHKLFWGNLHLNVYRNRFNGRDILYLDGKPSLDSYGRPALLWSETNLHVLGHNDLAGSGGLGVRIHDIRSNTTMAVYGYYHVNQLPQLLHSSLKKEKTQNFIDHHIAGGIEITSPSVTFTGNVHASPKALLNKEYLHSFRESIQKDQYPNHTVFGINAQILCRLNPKFSVIGTVYKRHVLCRAFKVVDQTIHSGHYPILSMQYFLKPRMKDGIELKVQYAFAPQWNMQFSYTYDSLTGSRKDIRIQWNFQKQQQMHTRLWKPVEYYLGPPLHRDISRDKRVHQEQLNNFITMRYLADEVELYKKLPVRGYTQALQAHNENLRLDIARLWFLMEPKERRILWAQYQTLKQHNIPAELYPNFFANIGELNASIEDSYHTDVIRVLDLNGTHVDRTSPLYLMTFSRIPPPITAEHADLLFQYFGTLDTSEKKIALFKKQRITYGLKQYNFY